MFLLKAIILLVLLGFEYLFIFNWLILLLVNGIMYFFYLHVRCFNIADFRFLFAGSRIGKVWSLFLWVMGRLVSVFKNVKVLSSILVSVLFLGITIRFA